MNNRKYLIYNHWFKESPKPQIPFYSKNKNLSFEDVKYIARLRLGSHYLEVEQGRFSNISWHNRICKRCSSNTVDDACHLLLECDFFKNDRDTLRLFGGSRRDTSPCRPWPPERGQLGLGIRTLVTFETVAGREHKMRRDISGSLS